MFKSPIVFSLLSSLVLAACDRPARTVEGNPAKKELTLVEAGAALSEIVVAKDALPQVAFAARELQEHIKKMSGAELPIVHSVSPEVPHPIFVGESEETRARNLSVDDLAMEGYRIVVNDHYVALLGRDATFPPVPEGFRSNEDLPGLTEEWQKFTGRDWLLPRNGLYDPRNFNAELGFSAYDPTGTLFAVYAFLEELGVRWYSPYEDGMVLPEKKTLRVPDQDLAVNPVFSRRFMRWGGFPSNDLEGFLWFKRQKLGMSEMTWFCHGTPHVTNNTRESHPEYRAVIDGVIPDPYGRKTAGVPRLAPPLRDAMIEFGNKFFEYFPDIPTFAAAPADGFVKIDDRDAAAGWDRKERGETARLSDYVWTFVNDVAKGLGKTHPDKIVMGLAYSNARGVPEDLEKLEPNVGIAYCQNRSLVMVDPQRKAEMEAERKAWLEKLPSGEFYIWEYYLNHQEKYGLAGVPVIFTAIMQEDAKSLRGLSKGEYVECSYGSGKMLNPALNHYPYMVQARLYWDPDMDLTAFLQEYCDTFYGPASAEMKEFFQFAEEVWMRNAPRNLTETNAFLQPADAERYADLLAAAAAKAGNSVYGRRVAAVVAECEPMFKKFEGKKTYARGVKALENGDTALAVQLFQEAADQSADSEGRLEALLQRAKIQNETLGDRKGAADSWLAIWNIPPKSLPNAKRSHRLDSLIKAAIALREEGQLDEALQALAEYEIRNQNGYWNFQILQEQGRIARLQGQDEKAHQLFSRALEQPNVPEAARARLEKELRKSSSDHS